jgi:hypothetical protein
MLRGVALYSWAQRPIASRWYQNRLVRRFLPPAGLRRNDPAPTDVAQAHLVWGCATSQGRLLPRGGLPDAEMGAGPSAALDTTFRSSTRAVSTANPRPFGTSRLICLATWHGRFGKYLFRDWDPVPTHHRYATLNGMGTFRVSAATASRALMFSGQCNEIPLACDGSLRAAKRVRFPFAVSPRSPNRIHGEHCPDE